MGGWFTSGRIPSFRLGVVLVVLVLFQLQCDRKKPTTSSRRDGTGAVVVEVTVPSLPSRGEHAAKATIVQGILKVTGEGMTDRDTTLVVQDGRLKGVLYSISVGDRTVSLSLQDGSGNTVWDSRSSVLVEEGKTVSCILVLQRVGDTPPQVDFQVTPELGKPNMAFAFRAQVSDRHDLTDSLRVRWDFESDGVFESDWMLAKSATHVFGMPGNYRVAVEARDRSGKTNSFTRVVQVVDLVAQTGRNLGSDTLNARLTEETIALDGSASRGMEGQSLIYHWRQVLDYPGGIDISVVGTLTDNDTDSASRVSFAPRAGRGLYVFTLQVELADLQSDPDTLLVWVRSTPPVVSVSPVESVEAGQSVILQGQATDEEGDALSYRWRGEQVEMLSDTTSLTPTFSTEEPGEYRFSLVAIDADPQESEPAEVVVTVVPRNIPPVADAGLDVTLVLGNEVVLDGSGSSDTEGESLEYTWTQKEGPSIELQRGDTATAGFAPAEAGRYVFSLVVRDGEKESLPDDVVVTVQENQVPVADAGVDQVVQMGDSGVLDGSGSRDAEGVALTYQWTAPTGFSLGSTTGVQPSFTAAVAGSYQISLVVNDGYQDSAPDTVMIRVNTSPVADAGVDQEVEVGATVVLDGSGSHDPDGDPLTFRWRGPSGIELSDTTVAMPTFTASTAGVYPFHLVVGDGQAESVPDTVVVTVQQPNRPPISDAGADQEVGVGERVQLDGSGSQDADGDALTYRWTQLKGSSVSLVNTASIMPSFTPDESGTYHFSLIVNDGQVDSMPDTVIVEIIMGNLVPAAELRVNPTEGVLDTLFNFSATESNDPDGDALEARWDFDGNGEWDTGYSSELEVTYRYTSKGDWQAWVEVKDSGGLTARDSILIIVKNRAPIANAGIDQNVEEGTTVTLDGNSSLDTDGDPLSYHWKVPEGIVLSDATAVQPSFTAENSGIYQFTLVVNDGDVDSAPDEVTVTVKEPITDSNWQQTITVSEEGGASKLLKFGVEPTATDGIDPHLGESELPPLPPSRIFDVRFTGGDIGNGLNIDLRSGLAPQVEHTLILEFQRAAGGNITLSWDSPQISSVTTSAVIQDLSGGNLINEDMRQQSQIEITDMEITTVWVKFTSIAGAHQE